MSKKIVVLFISFILLLASCNTTEPTPPDGKNPTLTLKLEDVSCTETWITLTTTNLSLPAKLMLKNNDAVIFNFNLSNSDTLIFIDSLLPNQTYTLQVFNFLYSASSNKLNVTTLDTTSHNITWQLFKFGEHQHSTLNDVTIIDENNIWAVGEIYLDDSLGLPDPNKYNVLSWDGSVWKIIRIQTYFRGNLVTVTLEGIFAFTATDIWLVGSLPIHGDGTNWQMYDLRTSVDPNLSLSKVFGKNTNEIYFVGRNGSIATYFNGNWSSEESNTEVDLFDYWGSDDGTLWTCGYSNDYGTTALLRFSGTSWETVYEGSGNNQSNGYYIGPISGVWGTNKYRIYMMNWGGIYIQANSNELFLEKEIADFSDVGLGIDGTDDNNIYACGEGFVGHWSGTSYKEYPELYRESRKFNSVSVKGNTVCAVGRDYNGLIYSQAVIALSK